jgi:tellurite resistance protein
MRPVLFGIVLGVGGLANSWRAAARLWDLPGAVADVLALAAVAIWFGLLTAYLWHWLRHPAEALAGIRHPAQGLLAALVPVATLIASVALNPFAPSLARIIYLAGLAGVVGFAVWGVGRLWQGGRADEDTTAVLYMPTVGGGLVAALASAAFGEGDAGWLFFGLGLLSFLAMESVIIKRLIGRTLPPDQRATLGVHIAPAAVASAALSSLGGQPGAVPAAEMLLGYGLFQALVLIRLIPWLSAQPFGPSAWAYTFGVSALPLAAIRLVEHGAGAPLTHLAPVLFVAANLIIGGIALRSAWRLATMLLTPAPFKPS